MLIYGVNVPEMTAIEFGSILKENPNGLIHFNAIDWDWKAACKANKQIAQGNALGRNGWQHSP